MMWKLFGKCSLTLIASMLAVGLFAFPAPAGDLSYGVRAGVNFAKINNIDGDYKMGYCAGAVLNYSLISMIEIQPEILYSMKGAKHSDDELEYNLTYLEIPVLVKLSLPLPIPLLPDLYAGPYAGFRLKAEYEGEDISEDIEKMDYGVMFGGGFGISLVMLEVALDARYSMGMKAVNAEGEDHENRVISGTASVLF